MKKSQHALQADWITPLAIVGESHLALSCAHGCLTLDALEVKDLVVDVLAEPPFMIAMTSQLVLPKRKVWPRVLKSLQLICGPGPILMPMQFVAPNLTFQARPRLPLLSFHVTSSKWAYL